MFSDDGKEIVEEQGELVCKKPFPSMPLYFWDDANGSKYFDACTYCFMRTAYVVHAVVKNTLDYADFDIFPNIWRHGDFAKVTKHGGVVISGRSDATLKPGANIFCLRGCALSYALQKNAIPSRWCTNRHGRYLQNLGANG